MATSAVRVAAVDLGASSGRVLAVEFSADQLAVTEAARFANRPLREGGALRWDIQNLYSGVRDGLRAAGPVSSIGIDSWAVDYGLLDASGSLLAKPVHYRDARTEGIPELAHQRISSRELYATTGIQVQPFNTIYQLVAEQRSVVAATAERLLLIPDLITYWLTGAQTSEVTNSSTTGLLDIRTRTWSRELMSRLDIPAGLFAPLIEAGTTVGGLTDTARAQTEQPSASVVAVGTHDTASAVAAVPALHERFAFVATGTWSLAGVELEQPVLTESSRAANFSNELGIDGTVRYLRNVMGLWLLQECLREWGQPDLGPLLAAAMAEPGLRHVIDAESAEFLAPGDMPARIAAACAATGQPPPPHRGATVRCILDSLALAHRRAIRQASQLSGRAVDVVHLVGGGARNALLCQLTADACGLPVLAGPVEAAALGNACLQARTAGVLPANRWEARAWLRERLPLETYQPRGSGSAWGAAERLLFTAKTGRTERAGLCRPDEPEQKAGR
jgi:rhamnulokinase